MTPNAHHGGCRPVDDSFVTSKSFRWKPAGLRQARDLAQVTGSPMRAMAELFQCARISLLFDGDPWALLGSGRGTLLIGDHRDGMESVVLLATVGQLSQDKLYLTGKPFSLTFRLIASLGPTAGDLLLPLIPRSLARDRENIYNRDIGWRLLRAGRLPSELEITAINGATVQRVAERLSSGNIVNFYPAGGMVDATRRPWRRGVGEVIKLLPRALIESVHVVMWRYNDLNPINVLRPVILRSHGLVPTASSVTLRIGPAGPLSLLIGDKDAIDRMSGQEIANLLRTHYVAHFA
jgi:hypothetical protein